MIRRPSTLPPIVSASSAYYLAHGLIIVGGLISMPAMTRLLSKAEYGLLGLLYATAELVPRGATDAPVADVVEKAIEKAIEQSAEVIGIRYHDDLGPLGGIGAVLRY